jgi:hypothetical protein
LNGHAAPSDVFVVENLHTLDDGNYDTYLTVQLLGKSKIIHTHISPWKDPSFPPFLASSAV